MRVTRKGKKAKFKTFCSENNPFCASFKKVHRKVTGNLFALYQACSTCTLTQEEK